MTEALQHPQLGGLEWQNGQLRGHAHFPFSPDPVEVFLESGLKAPELDDMRGAIELAVHAQSTLTKQSFERIRDAAIAQLNYDVYGASSEESLPPAGEFSVAYIVFQEFTFGIQFSAPAETGLSGVFANCDKAGEYTELL